MQPIQRTFKVPTNRLHRVNLGTPPDARASETTQPAPLAGCEVRIMEGRLGRIEWHALARQYDRAYEDTRLNLGSD